MGIHYVSFSDTYGLLCMGANSAPEMYRTDRKLPDEQQTKEVCNDRNRHNSADEGRNTGQHRASPARYGNTSERR